MVWVALLELDPIAQGDKPPATSGGYTTQGCYFHDGVASHGSTPGQAAGGVRHLLPYVVARAWCCHLRRDGAVCIGLQVNQRTGAAGGWVKRQAGVAAACCCSNDGRVCRRLQYGQLVNAAGGCVAWVPHH